MDELRGRTVLITGASSGVGLAAAGAFARAGCDVAVLARGEEGLAEAARRVRAHARRALVVPADVTNRAAVAKAVDRVEAEWGRLDVLVVNAAATIYGPFATVDPDDFDRVLAATFTGAVNTVRAALPALERSGGAIVATGSLMSKVPLPTFSSYAAAKHALRGFLGTLRIELRAQRSPVTVSMLHPGAIDTPVWEQTASSVGTLPRRPPEGYTADTIAAGLVGLAVNPHAEITVGAEAQAMEALFRFARPVGDLVLTALHHYYSSGGRPIGDRGALVHAVGRGIVDNGLLGRRSLTLPLRAATWPLRRALALR